MPITTVWLQISTLCPLIPGVNEYQAFIPVQIAFSFSDGCFKPRLERTWGCFCEAEPLVLAARCIVPARHRGTKSLETRVFACCEVQGDIVVARDSALIVLVKDRAVRLTDTWSIMGREFHRSIAAKLGGRYARPGKLERFHHGEI